MTKHVASDMRWHKEGRVNDGLELKENFVFVVNP